MLDDVEKVASRSGRTCLPVFVVYNLPNRDCSAKSSNGELSLEEGGEQRYRTEFIDRIAAAFAAHPSQRIAVVLEPDSLPNLVTNLGVPKCAVSQHVYKHSVAYAIARLSLPNVFIYLDSAHAGWLGWDGNRAKMVDVVKDTLMLAGGLDRIRGFATNVSNYTPLEGEEGKRLEPSNPCPNELTFVQKLSQNLEAQGLAGKGFIIDTSRNGKSGARSRWGAWCNVAGAGLGERPRAAPTALVDAYFWVKPPGDSDGTSDATATRFDESCVSKGLGAERSRSRAAVRRLRARAGQEREPAAVKRRVAIPGALTHWEGGLRSSVDHVHAVDRCNPIVAAGASEGHLDANRPISDGADIHQRR